MKNVVRILLFFTLFLYSQESEFDGFEQRQVVLEKLKEVIKKEEMVVKAYERYILNTKSIPNSINDLLTNDYLGADFFDEYDTTNYSLIDFYDGKLTYALKEPLRNVESIKKLYESDTFRNRTFHRESRVFFLIEDDFAKHLNYLILEQNKSPIINCDEVLSKRYCIRDINHIYIYTSDTVKDDSTLLMYYHQDRFRSGPMMITKDISLHSNKAFTHVRKGTIMYDSDGTKYIKTLTSVQVLK
jgi:hypothetical protein